MFLCRAFQVDRQTDRHIAMLVYTHDIRDAHVSRSKWYSGIADLVAAHAVWQTWKQRGSFDNYATFHQINAHSKAAAAGMMVALTNRRCDPVSK